MALEYTAKTLHGVMGARPVWMVPQIFNWASYRDDPEDKKTCRPPSLEEMRSMAWQCIAGGANGLVFYSWFDLWRMSKEFHSGGKALVPEPFEERWKDVKTVAAEIQSMFPILLSPDPALDPTEVKADSGIAWRLYGVGDDTVLVLVNSARTAGSAQFRFPARVVSIEALLGVASAPQPGQDLHLQFDPLDVKVIKIKVDATSLVQSIDWPSFSEPNLDTSQG